VKHADQSVVPKKPPKSVHPKTKKTTFHPSINRIRCGTQKNSTSAFKLCAACRANRVIPAAITQWTWAASLHCRESVVHVLHCTRASMTAKRYRRPSDGGLVQVAVHPRLFLRQSFSVRATTRERSSHDGDVASVHLLRVRMAIVASRPSISGNLKQHLRTRVSKGCEFMASFLRPAYPYALTVPAWPLFYLSPAKRELANILGSRPNCLQPRRRISIGA